MEINVGKLNELPEGSYQLIDMRSDRDFEYGTIPGAIHISQEDLQGNPQIIKSKKVILFCAHGTNSIEEQRNWKQKATVPTAWKAAILHGCGKRCADRKPKILKIRWNRVSGKNSARPSGLHLQKQ